MAKRTPVFPEVLKTYVDHAVLTMLTGSGVPLTVAPSSVRNTPDLRVALVGMRHEEARGSCLFFCNRSILARLLPDQPTAATAEDAALDDSCGEITNLVVGYLKRMFVDNQLKVAMTPPSPLGEQGAAYDDYVSRGANYTQHFVTAEGEQAMILVVLDAEMVTAFAHLAPDALGKVAAPGSMGAA